MTDFDNNTIYSDQINKIAEDKRFYGRMNDPTCSAWVKGICGDEMEFYLVVNNNKISDIKFYTTGCNASKACGLTVAQYVVNKDIYKAVSISPEYILNKLKDLPKENHHCSILACITFYKALGEFFVES